MWRLPSHSVLVISPSLSYLDALRLAEDYQNAKEALIGPQGPFAGWIRTGNQYKLFARTGLTEPPEKPEGSIVQ